MTQPLKVRCYGSTVSILRGEEYVMQVMSPDFYPHRKSFAEEIAHRWNASAEDAIDLACEEFLALRARPLHPGCPPTGADHSILRDKIEPSLAADAGVETGSAGRYPVGMQGGVR